MIDLPKDITQCNEQELTELIASIRARRQRPIVAYKAAQALAKTLLGEKLQARIDKELKMFAKALASVDKKVEELENRAVRITALRLEAGDITSGEQLVHG